MTDVLLVLFDFLCLNSNTGMYSFDRFCTTVIRFLKCNSRNCIARRHSSVAGGSVIVISLDSDSDRIAGCMTQHEM